MKTGLAEVEAWIGRAGGDRVGGAWDELAHVRQAVTFLVIHQKHRKSMDDITRDLCPALSVQQLYRIRWGGGSREAWAGVGQRPGRVRVRAPPFLTSSLPPSSLPSTMYWDDRYGTETVSHDVLAAMKAAMVGAAAAAASHSFLLDDDAALPFTSDDVGAALDGAGLYGPVPAPPELEAAGSFEFLGRALRAAAPAAPAAGAGASPGVGAPRPPPATPPPAA